MGSYEEMDLAHLFELASMPDAPTMVKQFH